MIVLVAWELHHSYSSEALLDWARQNINVYKMNSTILPSLYNFRLKEGARIILYDTESDMMTDILVFDPVWSQVPDDFYA